MRLGRRLVYRRLRIEGWNVNHKRVHHVWAIDFQFDQTTDGRRLKFLNVVDEYSRVCLAIRVVRRCKAVDVIDTIEELLKVNPSPMHLRMDNGQSSTSSQKMRLRPSLAGLVHRKWSCNEIHPTRITMGESIRGIHQRPVQG